MSYTATGSISGSLLKLRTLLSESDGFQDFVSAADAAAALLKIKLLTYSDAPHDIQDARPFAAIWPADRFDMEAVSWGGANYLSPGGDIVLLLTAEGHDTEADAMDFVCHVDEILNDLRDGSGVDDALPISRLRLLTGFAHSPPQDEQSAGAYWHVGFMVSWGKG